MGGKLIVRSSPVTGIMRADGERFSRFLSRTEHCSWYEETTVNYYAADCLSRIGPPQVTEKVVEEARGVLEKGRSRYQKADPGAVCP